jgi:hypothetical protein
LAKIPKIVHFCFGLSANFGFKPWSLIHYASVRSAFERLQPNVIFFYYEYEPQGPWWDATLPFITPIKIAAPRQVFGRPLRKVQHRADVLRLERLIETGGIYLDADIIVLRDFDDLLDNEFVISEEGPEASHGLSNAVLLAAPRSSFAKRWLAAYHDFSDEYWTKHSIQLPRQLAAEQPSDVKVLPYTSFVWPLHYPNHLKWIFESNEPIRPVAYTRHLWESIAWSRYLRNITPRDIRESDTNFGKWLAPLLTGLPDDYGKKSRHVLVAEKVRMLAGRIHGRFKRAVFL